MVTHSNNFRDQFQLPGSQSPDLRGVFGFVLVFKLWTPKSLTDLDPKIYHLAPHAKILIMTYVLQLCRNYISRYFLHNKRRGDQTELKRAKYWSNWKRGMNFIALTPVIKARLEYKRKHTATYGSNWAASAVCWTSFMLPPGKFTLSFHSTSFLQGKSRVTAPITITLLIHGSSHAPACSHRTALNQHTVNFYRQRNIWKVLSWAQQPPLLLGECWFPGVHSSCRPRCSAVFTGSFPWAGFGAHSSTEPCASCKLPEELDAARLQSYHNPQERSDSLGTGLWDRAGLASRTCHPQSWERTEPDHEALAVPELKLCFSVGFAAPLVS